MNIALVIGCARSGTSILGELIASHPKVKYIFEARSLWERGGIGADGSHRLTAAEAAPAVRAEIRRWFEEQEAGVGGMGLGRLFRWMWPRRQVLVEKCPRNVVRVPFIRAIFPEAKLIHIIRDGRDVTCSLIPGAGMDDWNHVRPPGWKQLYDAYSGASRCALAWKSILELALKDLEGVPHLEIRYEELVRQPQVIAGRLMEYLGLSLHPRVLSFCSRISDRTENSYHSARQVKWYVDNHKTRIGRWRENLSVEEQHFVQMTLEPLLRRLGYPTEPSALAS